jgi:hypothetical protein
LERICGFCFIGVVCCGGFEIPEIIEAEGVEQGKKLLKVGLTGMFGFRLFGGGFEIVFECFAFTSCPEGIDAGYCKLQIVNCKFLKMWFSLFFATPPRRTQRH